MALKDSSKEYADILNLPHHISKKHPRMSMHDRAAQFSPFSALTGYGEVISETARWTDEMADLDENCKAGLDQKLFLIMSKQEEKPRVTITYFRKDQQKAGGFYETMEGIIKKIDVHENTIVLESLEQVKIEDIIDIDSALFYSTMTVV